MALGLLASLGGAYKLVFFFDCFHRNHLDATESRVFDRLAKQILLFPASISRDNTYFDCIVLLTEHVVTNYRIQSRIYLILDCQIELAEEHLALKLQIIARPVQEPCDYFFILVLVLFILTAAFACWNTFPRELAACLLAHTKELTDFLVDFFNLLRLILVLGFNCD